MPERVILGASGLSVSPVSFGTWQLSPRFWGEQSKTTLLKAMRTAYDSGINFYDTAEAYGDGYAEEVLGEAIQALPRDEIVIATKVFNHFNPDRTRYPDLSPAHILERCDLSLKRLKTGYIDLYLLHFYDQLTRLAEITETLENLRSQGKIRHYGVSNFNVEQLRAARHFGNYTVLQPPYSLFNTQIEAEILPYCQAQNIGVMVYSPMHKGLLSGKYSGSESFSDFRAFHPDFQSDRFKLLAGKVQQLKPLAEAAGVSIYQLVLAATLAHPSIHVAIAGIKTGAQIIEATAAMRLVIDRKTYWTIRKILDISEQGKPKDASGGVK
ncbi:aldo/keto reductase [candidate division KSB1 bacterium]|nr:aldo/keto reductase [candidate division KSB1 bacterium]